MENETMKNYFEKEFELRYFEMNKFGVATPSSILVLLEEAAAEHCNAIDYSLYQLEAQNIGWVLYSGFVQIVRYPKYKEKIRIRTWLSKYSAIKGWRENIIYDEQNNIIGRAKGLWVFFDIKRRRPTQILSQVKERWSVCEDESIQCNINKKIKPVVTPDFQLRYNVNRFDTDTNKHVNNIRYLQWVLESIPDEIIDNYYMFSIDGRFISEATYGQSVISMTQMLHKEDSEDKSFLHTVKVEDTGLVCATAQTVWRKLKN